ncbi:MAG TPA: MFS transporter [Methanomicrobiales archaeon]|nr:MFS transporter [Methanomicrobiales archaeon]
MQISKNRGERRGGDAPAHDARSIFNILFITVFSTMIGLGIVIPLLPFYAESLGATGFWIGAIFSGYSLSRAIFMPLVGTISDQRGRKTFLLGGLILYTLLSFGYILSGTVYSLTAVRFIHGMASAAVIPVAMAYVADVAPTGEEGRYMGTFSISTYLGMGFGPFMGGLLKDFAGMDAVFLCMAGFSLVSLLICLAFLPESAPSIRARLPVKATLTHPMMRAVMLFQFMNSFANATFWVFLPVAAAILLGLSPTEIGIAISLSIFTTAIFQRPFGQMADRQNKNLLVVVGSLLVGGSLSVVPFLDGLPALLAASFGMGIGSAMVIPSATAITTIIGRDIGQGTAMGAYNTAASIGMIIAPVLSGIVMDLTGIVSVFLLSGVVSLLAVFVFWASATRSSTVPATG